MAVEWTAEKIAACVPLFGKVRWNLSPGDRCIVKPGPDDNDENVEIELVNSVGADSDQFMENKVWLLTSDDVETIILGRGYSLAVLATKDSDKGGISHTVGFKCWKGDEKDPKSSFESSGSDPHFVRLKLLQQVLFSEE